MLSLFALSVVLVGIYHAVRYHRTEWLFRRWRESVEGYSSDQLERNDLLDGDAKRINKGNLPLLALAYASLRCFLLGLLIAAFNFHEITNVSQREDSRARTQSTFTTSGAVNISSSGGADTVPKRRPATGQTDSGAERAGTGQGSAANDRR